MNCSVLKSLPTLGCTPPLNSSSIFSTVSTFGRGLTTLRVALPASRTATSATLATLALATFVGLVTRCFQEPEGTCPGEHVVFRCLSTIEVYFCARPGPVPSEEESSTTDHCTLPQHALAASPCGAVESTPLTTICVTHRPSRSGLGILVVLRVFTVWKGSGLVSSHGVCVLLFGARTGKGFVRGR